MRVYKAIQEGVWPKYTLYVCVRPGVRPSVLPAHVCGPVCGHVCCQMVCAAMCAARWCSWCSWYLLWRSSRRMDDTWEDFRVLCLKKWKKCSKMTKYGIYRWSVRLGRVWGRKHMCVATHSSVWPHTPCVGVFGPVLIPTLRVNPFQHSYLDYITFRTPH